MKFGLLGGTFDPVHLGHVDVARAVRQALDLAEVWLVPARWPPHRGAPHASASHRFAMTALAIGDEAGLLLSDLEMDTIGPSYTSETLDRLEARGVNLVDVCFVTGADAFRDIAAWKDYPRLLDRCHFAVVSRPGSSALNLPAALPALSNRMVEGLEHTASAPAIFLVDLPTAPVSSTDVRRAILTGQSIAGLVSPSVETYIRRHGLYGPTP